ncbi:MAG TPA: hypothetical protein VFE45_03705, partial [Coriobacteriia bacterium]|nr:hypothetical protein [Coriobacteriia bacterium]
MRQAWLADPQMMAYNARWNVNYPGYDSVTGCIDWPETQWSAFEARLLLRARATSTSWTPRRAPSSSCPLR